MFWLNAVLDGRGCMILASLRLRAIIWGSCLLTIVSQNLPGDVHTYLFILARRNFSGLVICHAARLMNLEIISGGLSDLGPLTWLGSAFYRTMFVD